MFQKRPKKPRVRELKFTMKKKSIGTEKNIKSYYKKQEGKKSLHYKFGRRNTQTSKDVIVSTNGKY